MARNDPPSSSHDEHTEYGGGPGRPGARTNRAPGTYSTPADALTPSELAQRMRAEALAPEPTHAMRQRRPGGPLTPVANKDDPSAPAYGVRIA
jgi:hypothetical protein